MNGEQIANSKLWSDGNVCKKEKSNTDCSKHHHMNCGSVIKHFNKPEGNKYSKNTSIGAT